jgi:acyl dehydratase
MPPRVIDVADLSDHAGEELGISGWHEITQERVDGFAHATDDHQWIHVDPARAAAGPFGRTIAHGFLTLSLLPALLDEVVRVDGCSLVVNYGLNRVRFPAPVPVASRVRLRAAIAGVEETPDGAAQTSFELVCEVEGAGKPCCVAEMIFRYYPCGDGPGKTPVRR